MSDKLFPGYATPQATQDYARQVGPDIVPGHFREGHEGIALASIGLGTYRGEADDATDAAYRTAITQALRLGCNHLDTAVNYRFQRSERAIGRALSTAIEQGQITREAVVIATKGGFVPFDTVRPADPRRWVYKKYIESGLVHPNEFGGNYQHCLAPAFLEMMIETSRRNLGLQTIDIYYLHNPETQRIDNTRETFRRRMLDAFETLEAAVETGAIRCYGIATWAAFRSPPDAPDYLSITELVGLAYQVAGDAHHLRYVQLPYNLLMAEAFALHNQQVGDRFLSAIEAAQEFELKVVVSASLKQGVLASPFMADLSPYFPGLETDAQRALQFARSTPGVTSALVGMSQPAHVLENMALVSVPTTSPEVIQGLFSPPES